MREFRELVEAHQSRIYSLACRMVGDTGLAEEVAQDAFLQLHANLDRIESEEHALAWLRRATIHRSTDALRRRARRVEFTAEEYSEEYREESGNGTRRASSYPAGVDVDSGTRSNRSGAALSNRVDQLIATLPETQRAIILLRYQEDLLPDEIATALAMPVATVKSHLQRALQLLRVKAERTLKEFSRVRE